jgi:hypothetical protein
MIVPIIKETFTFFLADMAVSEALVHARAEPAEIKSHVDYSY